MAQTAAATAVTRRRLTQLSLLALAAAPFAGNALPAWADAATQQPGWAWVNSDIAGNVTADADISLRDDFHAAINQEWLAATELGTQAQVSPFTKRNDEVTEQIIGLITGEAQTSHEGQLVQRFYADCIDMDARNARGIEPLAALVEAVSSIQTLDELTVYLSSHENRIAGGLFTLLVQADSKDSTRNAGLVGSPRFSLSDPGEYTQMTVVGQRTKDALEVLLAKEFGRLGYTDNEAAQVIDLFFEFESLVAPSCISNAEAVLPDTRERMYNPVTVAELDELSPTFPITTFLGDYIEAGVDRFILGEPDWLATMNELYVEDNLELMKAFLLYQTIFATVLMLDQESYDDGIAYQSAVVDSAATTVPMEKTAYSLCSSMLDMAVGKMYVDAYAVPEAKAAIADIIDQTVAVFRKRLEANEWLGDETRAKAIEKLDALKVRVSHPDDWSLYDYSSCSFPENGGLLEDLLALRSHTLDENIRKLLNPIDANSWPMAPQSINAGYSPADNSINVPAAILGGSFYDPAGTVASIMGSIGTLIGHEVTHGFDSNMGSLYDKDGNLFNWWTDEDRAAFSERTAKVSAYYSSIEMLPDVYVNGDQTIGETVADLGGMSCMLEIARDIDGLDYQDFFESYARMWRLIETEAAAQYLLQSDVHAPSYLRTNVTVQQFQEFYDTFGIVEGDGMYLAPEQRLSVW